MHWNLKFQVSIVYQAIVISANSIFLIAFLSVLDLRSFIRTLIFLFILVFVLDRIFIFELITHFFIHGTTKQLHQHVVTCATSFVQKAGVIALKEEKNEVNDMVKEYQRRRDYAVKAINEIDGLSCRCPKGAFYIFINIEKLGMTGQEFAPLLLENAKVALVPGDVFGTEGDHYVRMSFANSYENVVEGCKRLKEFVEKLRRNK